MGFSLHTWAPCESEWVTQARPHHHHPPTNVKASIQLQSKRSFLLQFPANCSVFHAYTLGLGKRPTNVLHFDLDRLFVCLFLFFPLILDQHRTPHGYISSAAIRCVALVQPLLFPPLPLAFSLSDEPPSAPVLDYINFRLAWAFIPPLGPFLCQNTPRTMYTMISSLWDSSST